jgi:hypothetical protein
MQFQQDFNRKERKERRDRNLWRFFFAIFVFFAVNSSLVAACRAGPWRLCVERSFLSVKSAKSVVQFLWLRLAALGNPWFNFFVGRWPPGVPCPFTIARSSHANY